MKRSIRTKFFSWMLVVSVLPMVAAFIFTLKSNIQFYQSQISERGNHEVQTKIDSMNSIFTHLDDVLTALIFSTYDNGSCMLEICSEEAEGKEPGAYQKLMNAREFEYISSNMIGTDQYVEGVYLFNGNGSVYSFVKNRELWIEKDYKDAEWYQAIIRSPDFNAVRIYQSDIFPEGTVIMGKTFAEKNGRSVLVIVCNDEVLGQVSGDAEMFLVDEEGKILYGEGDGIFSEETRSKISSQESGLLTTDSSEMYVYGTLEINNWKIVARVSFEELGTLYRNNMMILIGIIILTIFIVLGLVMHIDNNLLKPLMRLSEIMRSYRTRENVLPKNDLIREDEIGTLYRGYEEMLSEINTLIQEKYVSEIKYLKSKLQSLMSQINAHFIFNTLENISSLAFIANNTQIVTMSKSLGDMLRYSIEYERDEEKLSAEIEQIRKYIKIQEIRFGSRISLVLDIEEGLEETKVLKFMLQPIVENAIEHGLAESDMPWIIMISAYRERGGIVVSVQDNGVGMSEKKLKEIREHVYGEENVPEDSRYVSIGLTNIHKRIQLLYSDRCGLEIESPEDGGVKVLIWLPCRI